MPRTLYIIDGSPPARMAWMACVAAGVDVDIHRMDTLEKRDQLEDWFVKVVLLYKTVLNKHILNDALWLTRNDFIYTFA